MSACQCNLGRQLLKTFAFLGGTYAVVHGLGNLFWVAKGDHFWAEAELVKAKVELYEDVQRGGNGDKVIEKYSKNGFLPRKKSSIP